MDGKIIQIATSSDTENGTALYALTDQGQIYEQVSRYIPAKRDDRGLPISGTARVVCWFSKIELLDSDPGDEA